MKKLIITILILVISICYSEETKPWDHSDIPSPFIYNTVNVITGEYCEAQNDMLNDQVVVRRTYSSLHPQEGWTFLPIHRPGLHHTRKQGFSLYESHGQTLGYHFPNNSSSLLQEVHRSEKLLCRYHYHNQQIVKKEEADGRFLQIEYDPNGKVKRLLAPVGHDATPIEVNRFIYHDGWTEVYDALNHKVIYRYSKQDVLTAIEEYDEQEALYRCEKLFWDERTSTPRLMAKAHSDGQGTVLSCRTFTYNAHGNIAEETLYGHFTGKNATPIELQENGIPKQNGVEKNTTTYRYSTEFPDLLTSSTLSNGCSTHYLYKPGTQKLEATLIYDPNGIRIRHFYEYDKEGFLLREVIDDGYSPDKNCLSGVQERHILQKNKEDKPVSTPSTDPKLQYDLANRVIRITETVRDGRTLHTSFRYDLLGNRTASIDTLGNETSYEYDAFGRLVATHFPEVMNEDNLPYRPVERKQYDHFNRVISIENAKGEVTKTQYNCIGKPLQILYADGTSENYEYKLDGSLAKTINRFGIATEYTTDFLGRVLSTNTFDASGQHVGQTLSTYSAFHLTSTQIGDLHTHYTYDQNGHLTSQYNDSQHVAYHYDEQSNLLEQKEWFGPGAHDYLSKTYTPQETQFSDAQGTLLRTIQNQASQTPSHAHFEAVTNSLGQLVWQMTSNDSEGNIQITLLDALNRPSEISNKDAMGQAVSKQELRYDPLGNKVLETYLGQDGEPYTIRWRYGIDKRIEQVVEGAGSAQQMTTNYLYDSLGRLQSVVKPDGISLDYSYDASNRISLFTSSDHTIAYAYTYDAQHRVTHVEDLIHGKNTLRSYNSRHQVVSETLGNGLTLNNDYDQLNRRTQLHLSDGSSIAYDYNAAYLTAVRRLSPSKEEKYRHQYDHYDLNGRLLHAQLIGDLGEIQFNYRDQLLTSITTPFWSEKITDQKNGLIKTLVVQDVAGSETMHFAYDAQGQLTEEPERQYSYDLNRNRRSKNALQYDYNDNHQIVAIGDQTFIYNRNGCLIKKTRKGRSTTYSYDALNRLTQIQQGKKKINYFYDVFGRRLTKAVHQKKNKSWQHVQTEHYLYDGDHEIGCTDDTLQLKELRILGLSKGAESGAAIALELHGKIYCPFHDRNGSIRCLVDIQTHTVAECSRFTAFGEEQLYDASGSKIDDTLSGNPWRYAGKRLDPDTGLHHFGKRDYDPSLGRWITPDPAGFADGSNRYQYLQNNPMAFQDLYGYFSFSSLWDTIVDTLKSVADKIVRTVKGIVNSLQERCAYHRAANEVELIAEKMVGKTYLAIIGYYNDHPDRGTYGYREFSHVRITAINGILNLREHWSDSLQIFSDAHDNIAIHYVLHPTEGWTWDVLRGILIKLGHVSPQAKLLADTWKKLIHEMGGVDGGGTIIHYAHSLGGTDTLSARQLLSPEEQKMIHVITIGSATMIPEGGFGSVINFISRRDFVFLSDPAGFIKSLFDPECNVIRIGSHFGPPLVDHLLSMETYRRLIEMLGRNFLRRFT